MYGDANQSDFCGIEGPDDPQHTVLFALDADGNYIAVLQHNCSHATCLECGDFASADFPGEARRHIRAALGASLPVLYLQGASGDISPWNQLQHPLHYDGELRLREIGMTMAAETLRLLHTAKMHDDPIIRQAVEALPLAVRLPDEATLNRSRQVIAQGEALAGRWDYTLALSGVMRLQEEFGANPTDLVPVHAVRIGDFAIITNSCELFCQFGLDIKRRSPATVTAVTQLANGSTGYCPTIFGLMGGGYSGDAIYWCRLEPYAGYKIVEASTRMLKTLWNA